MSNVVPFGMASAGKASAEVAATVATESPAVGIRATAKQLLELAEVLELPRAARVERLGDALDDPNVVAFALMPPAERTAILQLVTGLRR